MYKEDSALNNLQQLICHKVQANQTKQVTFIALYNFLQTAVSQDQCHST